MELCVDCLDISRELVLVSHFNTTVVQRVALLYFIRKGRLAATVDRACLCV